MNVGDRVTLTDVRGTVHGTVKLRRDDGLCNVLWDNGVVERVGEGELKLEGRPSLWQRFMSLWR